jgi:hypothetical protein
MYDPVTGKNIYDMSNNMNPLARAAAQEADYQAALRRGMGNTGNDKKTEKKGKGWFGSSK